MKQVAIVGIQGVPAKYGGFETLVENIIGDNCCSEVRYTVFCSGKDYATRMKTYKGAQLKYIPLFHANGIQSTPYDILSMLKCLRGYDAVVILGVSGCIFLPIFRLLYRKQLIVNIDGLEHRRAKWSKFARWFLRTSEAMAVRYADVVITDNKGIQDYVTDTYHKHSELIAYGGNHVLRDVPMMRQNEILEKYGLTKKEYAISICSHRITPAAIAALSDSQPGSIGIVSAPSQSAASSGAMPPPSFPTTTAPPPCSEISRSETEPSAGIAAQTGTPAARRAAIEADRSSETQALARNTPPMDARSTFGA